MASSSSSRSWKYDVFLSFRGEDTRKTFVDHLYTALVDRLIHTYKDDKALLRGDTIGPSLFKAIDDSQIVIIVFSENYANSSWCLDELTYIMECREEKGKIVMPIFYHVEPTDVRKQKRIYEEAFAKNESNNNKIESWRKALVAAGNIAGWEINHKVNGYEAKCIKDIVGTILDRLLYTNSVVDESLVGMGTRLQDLKLQLKIGSGSVRMVGIWGIGGGGKTTLASSIYIEISSKFDSCCFLGNIKDKSSKSDGMETLQEKILSTVLKTKVKVDSVEIGKHTIKSRLGRKNVLLILDDVDDCKQLEALAGSRDWFGDGSRIIITTRDAHLLITHRVDEVSHVNLLSYEEGVRLFNKSAYNENNPVEDYIALSHRVVSYANGLPLALKILGSFLYDKDKEEWISTLDKLKNNPEMKIMEKLKISYDGLDPLEKKLFLDIACLWRKIEKDELMKMLDACGFHPRIGVKVLIQKSLITINPYGAFDMHDLVEELAHYIVRGEYLNNPEKHIRLWRDDEIKEMCFANEITENNITEVIVSYCSPSGFGKFLSKAKKLRLLYVYNDYDYKGNIEFPEVLSNNLRYMFFQKYPANPFPESFQPQKLVVLRLIDSFQEELWRGNKSLPCLKELEVSYAYNLMKIPDFGGLPCLQKLTLEICPKIKMAESNLHALKHLHKCVVIGGVAGMELVRDLFHEHIHLEELRLEYTRQPFNFYLPRFIRRLTLSKCGLEDGEIMFGIGELSNLQELDLSRNEFSVITFSLLRFTRLKILNLSWCTKLVEFPELPPSIAILEAHYCASLEVFVGDIINTTNHKWLCQVSFRFVRSVIGGAKLLQIMLKGNAIKNGCMRLQLKGVEILKELRPRPLLLKGNRYRLELSDNWYNHFSGFLFYVALRSEHLIIHECISLKHVKGGLTTGMDRQEEDVYWEENVNDMLETRVGYVSFGSLKHTTWWDPTSTNIEFSFGEEYKSGSIKGFGVCLVSQTLETDQLRRTKTTSSIDDDYKCYFLIEHDSRTHLKGIIQRFIK